MADTTEFDQQITYLEKLLAAYRARYSSGDKSIENQLRATAAKLEQLKVTRELKQKENKLTLIDIGKLIKARVHRSCCRGR